MCSMCWRGNVIVWLLENTHIIIFQTLFLIWVRISRNTSLSLTQQWPCIPLGTWLGTCSTTRTSHSLVLLTGFHWNKMDRFKDVTVPCTIDMYYMHFSNYSDLNISWILIVCLAKWHQELSLMPILKYQTLFIDCSKFVCSLLIGKWHFVDCSPLNKFSHFNCFHFWLQSLTLVYSYCSSQSENWCKTHQVTNQSEETIQRSTENWRIWDITQRLTRKRKRSNKNYVKNELHVKQNRK